MTDIETGRLILRLVSQRGLQATISGDAATVENELRAAVPASWLAGRELAELRLKQWQENAAYAPWSIRAIVEKASATVIGRINCHHAPMDFVHDGAIRPAIELGYEIYPGWQRRGLGVEAVSGFLRWAAAEGVTRFVLSIAPGNAASNALAKRLGATRIGSQVDEADGPEDVFLVDR